MMVAKRTAVMIFFAVLAGVSFLFDAEISRAMSYLRADILNGFFLGITFISSEIIIFFVLTSLFLWNENKRRWIFPLWATLFFSSVIGVLLKVFVHRLRPFQEKVVSTLPVLVSDSFTVWNYSFPSFQSMLVFCTIPILSKEFPRFKYAWMFFAFLVAFSRVYFGLHYASDVILGGIIGYLIGILIVKLETGNKIVERIYKFVSKH